VCSSPGGRVGSGMQFMTEPQPFWMVEPDRCRDLFATNVTGYFLLSRAVAPVMARAGTGKIVNVSVASTDSDGITDARVNATDFANGARPTRGSGESR
jgi:NAD(P)-dependent dehydrogenase (short-subunit alcohol dehydrogenase family)